jgi:hypothetical protein
MQLNLVTKLFQPGSQLHDADRRHPVGEHRKIGLAREQS